MSSRSFCSGRHARSWPSSCCRTRLASSVRKRMRPLSRTLSGSFATGRDFKAPFTQLRSPLTDGRSTARGRARLCTRHCLSARPRVSLRPFSSAVQRLLPTRSDFVELPASHRLPLSWLLEAASPPIQYRALAEAAPESARDPELLATLRQAVLDYKPAHAIARKQRDTGLWGGNLIGPGPSKVFGWKETGTVFQYRRLLELGWPPDLRPFRLTERFLFRLLSRDEAPELLVEFQRAAKGDPGFALWVRQTFREAAAAALARAGHADDPRLRGAAHKIASDIVMFLRGELVEKPFRKAQGKTVLDALAYPPTLFSMEMLAFLPVLQRERAGFIERLGHYLSTPAPRRAFSVLAGRKLLKPLFVVLGDPLRSDAQGRVTDVAFAVYWLELLA